MWRPDSSNLNRLIPAHAGSTRLRSPSALCVRAHPRSRGEHFLRDIPPLSILGSSPLTRGALPAGHSTALYTGLIPAHAGSTAWKQFSSRSSRAHPRSRGEHGRGLQPNPHRWGSSPLTRGARTEVRKMLRLMGLIPAHAGSTRLRSPSALCVRAHPRSRGEHSIAPSTQKSSVGSSPLTRGALGVSPRLLRR